MVLYNHGLVNSSTINVINGNTISNKSYSTQDYSSPVNHRPSPVIRDRIKSLEVRPVRPVRPATGGGKTALPWAAGRCLTHSCGKIW